MARCQCSHVPPHEVCTVLKHTLHCWKNPLQDLTALVAIVHPDEFWSLQCNAISLICMTPQALQCGAVIQTAYTQELAGMPYLNILAFVPIS